MSCLHLLAEIEPRVRVFNLDTGYQFPETLELRDRIAERYGIEVELIRPDTTVAEYEEQHGGPLYVSNPDQCCYDRKIVPLRRALVGYDAWITAIRADQSSHRARRQVVGPDPKFGLVKVNPLLSWTRRDVWAFIVTHRVPYNPLHDQGYAVDRLLAVHACGGRGRRRAGGPLGRAGQDGMRPALARQQSALIGASQAHRAGTSCRLDEDLREGRICVSGGAGPGAAAARVARRCASARSPRRTAFPSGTWCRSCFS